MKKMVFLSGLIFGLLSFSMFAAVPEKKQENAEKSEIKTGFIENLPITDRYYKSVKEIMQKKLPRAALTGYRPTNPHVKLSPPEIKKELEEGYPVELKGGYAIYVPKSYDGSKPYGVFLFVNSGDASSIPNDWRPILDQYNIICISPESAGNTCALVPRILRALDAYASAAKNYKFDKKRIYCGGTSGGGRTAYFLPGAAPGLFNGCFSMIAGLYTYYGEFFNEKEYHRIKWAMVTGDKDFNYKDCNDSYADYKKNKRFKYLFLLDIPGKDHTSANGKELEKVFEWFETCALKPGASNPYALPGAESEKKSEPKTKAKGKSSRL